MDLKEKKVSSTTVYEGKVIRVNEDIVKCPNDHLATREVVRRVEAACVLPILDDGRIVMERQYRYPFDEILFELPAGKCDYGEDHRITALRELEEETGYHAHKLTYLGKIYPTCGYSDEVIHLYLAQALEKRETHWDENEVLEITTFSLAEVKEMILNGKIVDAKTICAISLYLLGSRKE